jgi:hypothetical protein
MTAVENVSLVRESSNPKVYLVVGGTKFWITDPVEFDALGFRWERVRVLEDGSLKRFREAQLHPSPETRPSDVYFDCQQTYWAIDGTYYSNCCSSVNLVRKDVLVSGWLRDGMPYFNRYPDGLEDIHYDLTLDADFLERMYGTNGLSNALVSARWPGNPLAASPLRLATVPAPPGGQRGTPFSSWILPGYYGPADGIHPELQAWHPNDEPPPFTGFHSHSQGRGQPYPGWQALPEDDNAWFPFDPRDPDGSGSPLMPGDYVVMRGALWQDTSHGGDPWETGSTVGHGGGSEIHPPDYIIRVAPPRSNVRLTVHGVRLITPFQNVDQYTIVPDFVPSAPSRYLQVRRAWAEVDRACTDATTLDGHYGLTRHDNSVESRFAVAPTGSRQGRFKGTVFVAWAELDSRDEIWVNDSVPIGATIGSDSDGWVWTADLPGPFIGDLAHVSTPAEGLHQHYFTDADTPIVAVTGDHFFCMVYLQPDQPPDEIMMQFFDGSWDHRAFWGADRIGWGTGGTASRHRAGDLPPSGEWVRLEVDVDALGLRGRPVSGAAFTCFGGGALWDYMGKSCLG